MPRRPCARCSAPRAQTEHRWARRLPEYNSWWKNSRGARPAAGDSGHPTGDLELSHDYQNGSFSLVIRVPANWYAAISRPTRYDGLTLRRPRLHGAAVRMPSLAKFAHPIVPSSRSSAMAHADEQHGRADYGRQVLAQLGRSPLDRVRVHNEDLNQVTWNSASWR